MKYAHAHRTQTLYLNDISNKQDNKIIMEDDILIIINLQ